jgi:hypothetical protein
MMKFKDYTSILIYNILALVVWAALAYLFGHWWIALFSILFLCFPKTIKKHYRICDKCGKRSAPADTAEEAIRLAENAGWFHFATMNQDYCPDCRNTVQRRY